MHKKIKISAYKTVLHERESEEKPLDSSVGNKVVLKSYLLNINGNQTRVVCKADDTLLTVIRNHLKLTGTKRGCECGQCGVCNVIVNGKVMRACIVRMKSIPEHADIMTVEGLGTPDHLHAIQWAFIANNAIQCGFCTPGFVMAAKGLLDTNLNPTREDVRDWLQKHWCACRCTGYKQIVNAVMDAAAVLRGEKEMEDFGRALKPGELIWGTNYPRPSDKFKVTGTWDFGDDAGMKLPPNTLYAALVHADVNHAEILSLDIKEAERMPGVVKVVTADDIYAFGGTNKLFGAQHPSVISGNGWERPILCDKKIFMWGDVTAVVCAESYEQAEAAALKVRVELKELPALMDVEDALAPDAPSIHEGVSNVYLERRVRKGKDAAEVLDSLPHVVENVFYLQRQPHLTLENDVGFGYWDEDGNLTIQSRHISIYRAASFLARGIGIPSSKIRIIQNHTGASFGYKLGLTCEGYIAAAVIATGRPVFCRYDTKHHVTYTPKRAPFLMKVALGADEEGHIRAIDHKSWVDHGPYSEFAPGLVVKLCHYMGALYGVENVNGVGYAVYTNQKWNTAFRAWGAPQVHIAQEIAVDMLAEKVGMDPLEFRYLNAIRPGGTFPHGHAPDVYPLPKMVEILLPRYQEALKRAKEESTETLRKGVGVAFGVYNSNVDGGDTANCDVELMPDGGVMIYNTWEDHGQGADIGTLGTAHRALVPLGLQPDRIHLFLNDTYRCPNSGPAAASRCQVMVGQAIIDGCNKLMDAMRRPDGTFRTYDEMVGEGLPVIYHGTYECVTRNVDGEIVPVKGIDENGQGMPYACYMYGLFMAEVDVDVTTGKTWVSKMTLIDDVGVINNYGVVDGQMYGGLAQGIGLALYEDFEDPARYNNLVTCGFPYIKSITDDMELIHMETPREFGPWGASGAGELPLTAPHPAIINAIYNAVGVRVKRLPAKPEKIKALLREKQQ